MRPRRINLDGPNHHDINDVVRQADDRSNPQASRDHPTRCACVDARRSPLAANVEIMKMAVVSIHSGLDRHMRVGEDHAPRHPNPAPAREIRHAARYELRQRGTREMNSEGDASPDRSLDVSTQGEWLTYDEIGQNRGIGREGAVQLARRKRWRRQPGSDGTMRIFVPADGQGRRSHQRQRQTRLRD